MAGDEGVLVFLAQVHDGRHVDIIECGQHRGRVLRLFEAAGDGLAQARHPYTFFTRAGFAGRAGLGIGHRGHFRLVHIGKGVGFGGTAVAARARNAGGIDIRFGSDASHGRGDRAIAGAGGRGRRGDGSGRDSFGCGLDRSGGGAADARDDRAGRDRGAGGDEQFDDDTVGGRRDFERDLVGLDLGDGLVLLHLLADLLGEGGNRAFGDALAHDGDLHVGEATGRRRGCSFSLGGRSRWGRRGGLGGRRRLRGDSPCPVDPSKEGADADRLAFRHGDVGQDSIFGRGHLDRDLVGFKLDEHFVLLHCIALGFQPAADRGFRDAFAEGGYNNVCHWSVSGGIAGGGQDDTIRSSTGSGDSAILMSEACSAWCFDRRPVAVAALGGRPEYFGRGCA